MSTASKQIASEEGEKKLARLFIILLPQPEFHSHQLVMAYMLTNLQP
jgi:hypothetical protein